MEQSISKYIGQEIKNAEYRKKHNKRVSTILSEMRFHEEEDKDRPPNRFDQIEVITSELGGRTRSSVIKSKRQSGFKRGSSRFSEMRTENGWGAESGSRSSLSFPLKDEHPRRESGFRVRQGSKTGKLSCFKPNNRFSTDGQFPSESTYLNYPEKPRKKQRRIKVSKMFQPKLTTERPEVYNLFKFKPVGKVVQDQEVDLQHENFHKLSSLIRGAYDSQLNEFSDVINLSLVDNCRRDFYIFSRLYEEVADCNAESKLSIRDVGAPNLRDVVLMNEQKDHAGSPEYIAAMRRMKVIR